MSTPSCIHDAAAHDWSGGDETKFVEGLCFCGPPADLSFRLLCDYAIQHDRDMVRRIADLNGGFRAVVELRFAAGSVYLAATRSRMRWRFFYAATAEEAEHLVPRLALDDGGVA